MTFFKLFLLISVDDEDKKYFFNFEKKIDVVEIIIFYHYHVDLKLFLFIDSFLFSPARGSSCFS